MAAFNASKEDIPMHTNIRVVVVEDARVQADTLAAQVRRSGFAVDTADCCEKALNKMIEYADVVLIDGRAEECVPSALGSVKGRVSGAGIIIAHHAQTLKSLRFAGDVRADAYVALEDGEDAVAAAVMAVFQKSPRFAVRRTRRLGRAA